MTSQSITTLVRKWSYQTHSLNSVLGQALTCHWILLSTTPCIMPDHKEAFQQAFVNDPEMQALANLIITGWPEDIKEVPHPLCPYWQYRETLTIEDSLVLQGEALIIPPAERERVIHQLHQFHQGITKSQLLMHGIFFWPGINKAIKEVTCQCEACSQFQS